MGLPVRSWGSAGDEDGRSSTVKQRYRQTVIQQNQATGADCHHLRASGQQGSQLLPWPFHVSMKMGVNFCCQRPAAYNRAAVNTAGLKTDKESLATDKHGVTREQGHTGDIFKARGT